MKYVFLEKMNSSKIEIDEYYAPINVMPAGGEAGHRVGI